MRIPRSDRNRSGLDGESMTPMIDVVFLLLVFFVCAAIGQKPESILPAEIGTGTLEANPVELQTPDELPLDPIEVRLERQAGSSELAIRLNDQPVATARELTIRLRTLADLQVTAPVVLDVADDVSVQQFIAIYDLCQSLRFSSIAFAVRQP